MKKYPPASRALILPGATALVFVEGLASILGLPVINYPAFGGALNQDETSLGSVAHRFRTTRWTMVLRLAQSQVRGFQATVGGLCLIDWYPHYSYIRRRTVSERTEIEDELRALCAALTASEGRLGL